MGQVADTVWQFVRENWGCISVVGFLGLLIGGVSGCIITRRIMAPAFCPSCIQRERWQRALASETKQKTPEEKAESRRFYWLRRKSKKPPSGDPPDAT